MRRISKRFSGGLSLTLTGGRWHSPKKAKESEKEGDQMKAITKTDIKRARRAIKIADQGNDYDLITWAFGEIEDILNKAEKVLEKEVK
jgi:hypothetical protein